MSDTGSKARDAAASEAASVLTYLAIMGLVSLAILKRYHLTAWWRGLTAPRMSADRARVEREVAEFRRELAAWGR